MLICAVALKRFLLLSACIVLPTCLPAGVSGPVQFDMFGDAVVHSESYIVYSNFNVTTQKYDTVGYAS
jgi:hypothetical protein